MSNQPHLPYNGNLPPGCSIRDIDPHVCSRCDGAGTIERVDCNQDEIDELFQEGEDEVMCPTCNGLGVENER